MQYVAGASAHVLFTRLMRKTKKTKIQRKNNSILVTGWPAN